MSNEQQSAPAGYVMVPVELLERTILVMDECIGFSSTCNELRDLLAAAPKAVCRPSPAAEQGGWGMNTFTWKWWRFAWLASKRGWWNTTAIDGSGVWKSILTTRLCVLTERRYDA